MRLKRIAMSWYLSDDFIWSRTILDAPFNQTIHKLNCQQPVNATTLNPYRSLPPPHLNQSMEFQNNKY